MVCEKRVLIADPEELSLRHFISHLAGESRKRPPLAEVPEHLHRLAGQVLRRVPVDGQLDGEDLVALLLLRLLEQKRRRGARVLEALVEDQVRSLGAVLRHRMRQIATEYVPGRKVRRELRVHIRAALERPGRGPARRPESLQVGDRYSARLVAQAVRWLLAEDVKPELRELERELIAEFNLGTHHVPFDSAPALQSHEPGAEVVITARALRTVLGEERMQLLGRRLAGSTIEELAKEEGRGLATIHEHLRRAEEVTGAFFADSEVSPRTARASLELLRRP